MRIIHWLLGLVAILLVSCAPVTSTPLVETTQVPVTATFTPFVPVTATYTFTPEPTATIAPTQIPPVSRVLIITVDGLHPEAILQAPMPILQGMMAEGAYTLTARTIYPSSTLPAHASMLTGLCPDQHGVTWNDYLPANGRAEGDSIFDIAQRAGLKTVMIVGKEKLKQVSDEAAIDIFKYINDRDSVIVDQAAPILAEGFDLALVHLPLVDILGHEYGWLSPNYLIGAIRADEAVQTLLDALETAGLLDTTLIIITADHGGSDTSHGLNLPEHMTIPWIISGPRVVHVEIAQPIHITDTAATVLWALKLPKPQELVGQVIFEAFGEVPGPRSLERCP